MDLSETPRPQENVRRDPEEIRLPRAALAALVGAARRDPGGLARALREAGRAVGAELASRVAELVPLEEIGMRRFWEALNAESAGRGLGSFLYAPRSAGVAEISCSDWPERTGAAGSPPGDPALARGDAPFTEGLVEGMLSRVVGEPIGVLVQDSPTTEPPETEPALRLLVGSPVYLRSIRLRLEAGAALGDLLEES
jgi:hypothetical protein